MSGRGGAGNILAVQQEKARFTEDVEANRQQTSVPAHQETKTQEYAHSGRGGAGNYYSPRDLKDTGHFSNKNPIANTNASRQTQVQHNAVPVVKYGRGGAGNMSYGVDESEENAAMKKLEEERLKREKIEVEIEREASSIAMPPKAKLPLPGNDPNESF